MRILILLTLLLLAACQSPRAIARKGFKQEFLRPEKPRSILSGFVLFDPGKEKVLYSYNPDRYFTPASNTKLYTLYTALHYLPDSLPAIRYARRNDTLFLMGTGDPSLLHPDLPDHGLLDWLCRAGDSLSMVVCKGNFYDQPLGPGWAWDDTNEAYSCEKSALPVHGNFVRVVRRGDSVRLDPDVGTAALLQSRGYPNGKVRRKPAVNHFYFNPALAPDTFSQDIPVLTQGTQWGPETLRRMCFGTAPGFSNAFASVGMKGGLVWHTKHGLPLDSVLIPFMHNSDNFLAEQLMLMVSGQTFQDTLDVRRAIGRALDSLMTGLPDPPRWVDGSGLSRYNLFTPRDNLWLLERLFRELPRERLMALFPAGGVSGTLDKWYAGPQGRPYVFAKTGTLSNNHCLSGYLRTRRGRWYIFTFMHNHFVEKSSAVKRSMERILREIYEKG